MVEIASFLFFLEVPACDVGVGALAAFPAVGAEADDLVRVPAAGLEVDVGVGPWVAGDLRKQRLGKLVGFGGKEGQALVLAGVTAIPRGEGPDVPTKGSDI